MVLNATHALVGVPIPPLRRLRDFSDEEWEEFVHEWVDSLRAKYVAVHRCGGPGDMGRDVIAFKAPVGPSAPWDNYQCKRFNGRPLRIADVVREVGKLLYYVSQGEFSLPDAYTFVAPLGPSTALLRCLQNGELRQEVLARWDNECRSTITTTQTIELAEVQAAMGAFDFFSVTVMSALKVLEGHQQTTHYVHRFGGGLPVRALPATTPSTVQSNETVYVKKLLDAYGDEKQTSFPTIDALEQTAPPLAQHLQRSREQFFTAESLRTFSRDTVKTGTFEQLQNEIYDGIQEIYADETYPSGYQRVVKTVQKARDLQITGNILTSVLHTNDRAGICHQLANDDRLTWVMPKEPEDKSS